MLCGAKIGMEKYHGHGSHLWGLSAPDHSAQLRKAVIPSTIGTTIEWYDFFIYGVTAGLIFGECPTTRAETSRWSTTTKPREIHSLILTSFSTRSSTKRSRQATQLPFNVEPAPSNSNLETAS